VTSRVFWLVAFCVKPNKHTFVSNKKAAAPAFAGVTASADTVSLSSVNRSN
jgi:hypothetical protein